MQQPQEVWLIYDGECPICKPSANALKIRDAVGKLHLVNARESHPILKEITDAGINLDEGMVVKFNHTLYHGADAQHVLAVIGTTSDWINRLNVVLFRSKVAANILYPVMKSIRSLILKLKGISKINNLGKSDE